MQNILITCKEHYEKILAREIESYCLKTIQKGQGWILAQGETKALLDLHDASRVDLCFSQRIYDNPLFVEGTSVNSLAEKLAGLFINHLGQVRVEVPWPFLFSSSGNEQHVRRMKSIQQCWHEKIKRKMARVIKLGVEGLPHSLAFSEGFFVYLIDFHQAVVSFKALSNGQQRMRMDEQAPSRSYLKIEEAFHLFGCAPQEGDSVVDLGASPGGWSYSALKRGARVLAVDHGALKEPVRSHPGVNHFKEDAFLYQPQEGRGVDWLLCDILEDPEKILQLLSGWLSQRRCRYFIVNLKLGRWDPIVLLREIRDTQKGLASHCVSLHVRQLYHDREEMTLMGQVK